VGHTTQEVPEETLELVADNIAEIAKAGARGRHIERWNGGGRGCNPRTPRDIRQLHTCFYISTRFQIAVLAPRA